MKKIISTLLIFLFVFTYITNDFTTTTYAQEQAWPQEPDIFAETGVVIEASTGAVLYNKNMNQKMYPASITKILTCLIALEESSLDDMVTCSHDAAYSLSYDDANIGFKEGETLSMKDCIYAILLKSANEVAYAVAEDIGGSVDGFAEIMNERAKQAGALNSNFVNPNGLFNENHYTTAYDMAMITRDAIKLQSFLDIEKNTTYSIAPTSLTTETRYLTNRHKMLLPSNSLYYEGALGGKTGYVDQSGNTLVTFAKRNGMTLISVIMKSDSTNVYSDTAKLLDYGFNNFKLENISQNETAFSNDSNVFHDSYTSIFGDNLSHIKIDNTDSIVLPINADFTDTISQINFTKKDADNTIGTIDYQYDGNYVGKASIKLLDAFTNEADYSPTVKDTSTPNKGDWIVTINIWLLLFVIVLILAAIYIFLRYKRAVSNRKRRKYLKKKKQKYRKKKY